MKQDSAVSAEPTPYVTASVSKMNDYVVELSGPADVKLTYAYRPEDGKRRCILNLAIPISEEEFAQAQVLTRQKGTWFVTLGVEGIQAMLDDVAAAAVAPGDDTSPVTQSRVEEAVAHARG